MRRSVRYRWLFVTVFGLGLAAQLAALLLEQVGQGGFDLRAGGLVLQGVGLGFGVASGFAERAERFAQDER